MNENVGFGCFIIDYQDEEVPPKYIGYGETLDMAKEKVCDWVRDSEKHTLITKLAWGTHLRDNDQIAFTRPIWKGTDLATIMIYETPVELIPVLAAMTKENIE